MARKLPRSGLLAAPLAGVALALTLGARTLPAPDGSWLGVLPATAFIVALVCASVAVTVAWSIAARTWPWLSTWPAAAWSGVLVAVLPWLPLPLAAARFAWLGPLAWLPWIAAIVTGIACVVAARPPLPAVLANWITDRRRASWLAGGVALVVFTAGYSSVRTILPGGDEPHYLVIAESLRRDGDLAIDDNHERGDYLAFFRGELTPDYLRRGVDRRIYSIHAPGLPALLLPAYAAGGYAGVIAALLLVTAGGTVLLWRLAHDVTADAGAAWFAWAAAVAASPILFHAFTVFPDGVAGVAALVALRGLTSIARVRIENEPATQPSWMTFATSGLALAALPWLHTRAAVIAATFGLAIVATAWWRRTPWRRVAAFAVPPVLSAVGWFFYFLRIYGTPDPSAPYGGYTQTGWAQVPAGVAGLLLDAQFGLLGVAPVFVLALLGLGWMLIGGPRADAAPGGSPAATRIVAVTIAVAFVGYTLASASYRMWWGGASAPARFLVPMLLPLAVPIGVAWSRTRGVGGRALAIAALVVTVGITLILLGVDDGRLAYGSRTAVAGWARWASPAVDLARALPGVHRSAPGPAAALASVWAGAAVLAWLVIAAIARGSSVGRARALSGLVLGLAATAAIAIAWHVDGLVDPRLPGGAEQAALATWQRHPRATLIAARGAGVGRTAPADARAHLVLEARPTGAGRQLHLELPTLAPGRYRLMHVSPLPSPLALRAGRSGLDWRRLDSVAVSAIDVDVPVTVPSAAAWPLDASAAATAWTPRTLTFEPLGVAPSATGAADVARQVVRYGAHDVFFLDDESYPEAPGFWVRPGRSRVVVGETAGPLGVFVRNAPIANRVELTAGTWQRTLDLAPGQEMRVEVPPAGPATPLTIRAARGVRPFDGDRRNRDFRLLGVWIAID
ncbi:MAG: hypothetical protein ABIT71_23435 [Vicinamibacteraceae bacterium]